MKGLIARCHNAGLCKVSNEEHARDLPIMNGIKEDIKSAVVLDLGSSVCQEALSNLSKRLKLLQVNFLQAFYNPNMFKIHRD